MNVNDLVTQTVWLGRQAVLTVENDCRSIVFVKIVFVKSQSKNHPKRKHGNDRQYKRKPLSHRSV